MWFKKSSRFSIKGLARKCAGRPWVTISAWIFILMLSVTSILTLLTTTTDYGPTKETESMKVEAMLEDRLRGPEKAQEVVIIRSESITVDSDEFQIFVEQLLEVILDLGTDLVESGYHYYQTNLAALVSDDRHTTIIPLVMAGTVDDAQENIDKLHKVIDRARASEYYDMQVYITGPATLMRDSMIAAKNDLEKAEIYGLPIAFLVLVLVFGTVVAAMVPVLLAIFSIIVALGIAALIGQVIDLSLFVTNMIAAMGFALGIDYSLFVVYRYREERARGLEKMEAIVVAGDTAGHAIFFSGVVVVLALLGVVLVPTVTCISIATGAILVVIAAVVASVTLLPAMLSLLGDRIDALRVPFVGLNSRMFAGGREGGFWDWVARKVTRWPIFSAIAASAILVVATIPIFDIELGAAGVDALPDGFHAKEGYRIVEQDFSYGLVTPTEIVIVGETDSDPIQQGIAHLKNDIGNDASFSSSPSTRYNESRDLALISAQPRGDPTQDDSMDAINRIRDDYIPAAFNGVEAEVLVGGISAWNADYISLMGYYMPLVFVFVLCLSFVLLTVVFRSIVVPIKAILMNLLSVGAAYGLVVLVFQKGFMADQLGLQQVAHFEAWIPVFLLCWIFGLSTDYHVFLLTRVRERFEETQDNSESVVFGLRTTGGIITGAALIMVAVFSGVAAGEMVQLQQFGFGLSVAVLIDATIIRSVLVPASMELLGKWNWYLPKWLEWLPDLRPAK